MTNRRKINYINRTLDKVNLYYRVLGKVNFDMQCIAPKKGLKRASEDVNELSSIPFKLMHSKKFMDTVSELYFNKDTWEQAEVKLIEESVDILLKKSKNSRDNIDLFISGDLLNQIGASNYASVSIGIPFLGIYSACASYVEGLIIASNMIDSRQIKIV